MTFNSWQDVTARLDRIRTLRDDWDGEGTPAPTVPIVDHAMRLVDKWAAIGCRLPTYVLAGVNGTVIFEWFDDDLYCEVEVESGSNATVYLSQ